MKQAYLWPIDGENDEVVFHYAPSQPQPQNLRAGYQQRPMSEFFQPAVDEPATSISRLSGFPSAQPEQPAKMK